MKMKRLLGFIIAVIWVLGLGTAGVAQTSAAPSGIKVTKMGDKEMVTDASGMTLYVYDADAPGKSNCNGACATNWPPLVAGPDAKPVGNYTIVTRDDGSKQWALNGKPLYHWKNDKQPGDMTGDGVGGKWHAAAP
jgi:predicted lipoprotein with Yx(FWY)xxD motif